MLVPSSLFPDRTKAELSGQEAMKVSATDSESTKIVKELTS